MTLRRKQWTSCLAVFLPLLGATSLQAQTLDPTLTGPVRVIADRAFAAYQKGDYALAKAMAQAALRMNPDSDSLRRLLAVTENGGTRGGRWTNPFLSPSAASASSAAPAAAPAPAKVAVEVPVALPTRSGPAVVDTSKGRLELTAPELSPPPVRNTGSAPPRSADKGEVVRVKPMRNPVHADGVGSGAGVTSQKIYDLIKSGDAAGATQLASRSLQERPGDRRMWEAYTNALFAQGRHHEADDAVASAIKRFGPDEGLNALRDSVKKQLSVAEASGADQNSPGWKTASQAYKDFDRGEFAAAANGAVEAVRLVPENKDYRQLLVYALQSASRFEEAEQAINDANAKFGEDTRWMSARSAVRGRLAVKPAENVYRALERNDVNEAIAQARRAVFLAPDVSQYHGLLIHVLLRAEKFADADVAATEAIQVDPEDASPRVLRAYARHRLAAYAKSADDFDAALALPDMDDTEQRNLRLIAADAALAADDPARALTLLEAPVFKSAADDAALGASLAERRRMATAALQRRPTQTSMERRVSQLAEPIPNCRLTPYGRVCILVPGQTPTSQGYTVATEAYRALGTKTYEVAVAKAREAVALSPASLPYRQLLVSALVSAGQAEQAEAEATQALALDSQDTNLLMQRARLRQQQGKTALANEDFRAALAAGGLDAQTEVSLLADLGRKSEARKRLDDAVDKNQLAKLSDLDVAYLSAHAGDDDRALAAFKRSDKETKLPSSGYADVAFTAIRLKMDTEAIGYFKRTVDAVAADQMAMDDQTLFNTRRAVAEVSREYGAVVGLSFRGTGGLLGGAASSSAGAFTDSVVAGVEGYWRPFGYRGGQHAELFARGFYTLRDKAGGLTGSDSIVGAVGARLKPLTDHSLLLSLWRQFPVSSALKSDWVAQASYFTGKGLDLRVTDQSWWTAQFSADAGRYIEQKLTYGLVNARIGRSFRLDSIDPKLVVQPHAALAADYSSAAGNRTAVGVGPGLNMRYWFREDKYTAPMSYVDFSVQYRARIAGDQRAKGPFVTLTTSY